MSGTNKILEFAATDTGTNLLSDTAYAADAQRSTGNQPGTARSPLVNKALRQTSLIAAAVAQFIADNQANDVVDTATPATIESYFLAAINAITSASVLAKTATYTTVTTDRNRLIDATSGTWALNLLASATAGSGFRHAVRNSGAGVITITPNGAETIDAAATLTLLAGDEVILITDGANWKTISRFIAAGSADPSTQNFILSLTTGVPVNAADVVAAGTLYAVPNGGNKISLYNGSSWNTRISAQFALTLAVTSGAVYDVYCYDNAGVPTLELLAWTNATTRATGHAWQDGVRVKAGDATRRYMGALVATGTNITEDSYANRYLSNYYFRRARPMRRLETAATWTLASATIRQANASGSNQLNFLIGVTEDVADARIISTLSNNTAAQGGAVYVGLDSTTTPDATALSSGATPSGANTAFSVTASYHGNPGIGKHALVWLEVATASGTATFVGASTSPNLNNNVQSGMHGEVWG